jgi:hypothetical protein
MKMYPEDVIAHLIATHPHISPISSETVGQGNLAVTYNVYELPDFFEVGIQSDPLMRSAYLCIKTGKCVKSAWKIRRTMKDAGNWIARQKEDYDLDVRIVRKIEGVDFDGPRGEGSTNDGPLQTA